MTHLRALILEDSATDAELAVFELERAGLAVAPERVATRDGFIHALREFKPDVVLADYSLPNFDGNEALHWVTEHHPHIPVIIVTGALGDELAIELIKAGARDYVLKSNLVRLGSAVLRALGEAAQIEAREKAERALTEQREKLLASLELRVQQRTEQLRAMAFELTKTEERERQAIARDLHDSLGQTLAIAKIKLDSVRGETTDSEIVKSLSTIIKLIDESNQSVRSLAAQLSPPALYDLGLISALEWLAEQQMRDFGLRVRIDADELVDPLDPAISAISAIMFRAVRELLINIVKHADVALAPVNISISVVPANAPQTGELLQIVVADTGKGFEPAAIKTSTKGGFGLLSVRERLAYIGGGFDIVSKPGRGTTATLTAPLELSGA